MPKTLARALVRYEAKRQPALGSLLLDIVATPISPELLPTEEGKAGQETEAILGPYAVHDFFLYHFLDRGLGPEALLSMAVRAFPDLTEEKLLHWMEIFFSRFFRNQFKRSCSVEGPTVGKLSLSPRGGWQMASDLDPACYLEEIQRLRRG